METSRLCLANPLLACHGAVTQAFRGGLSVKGSDEVRQKDLYDSARFKGLLQWTMGSEQLWLLPRKKGDGMISVVCTTRLQQEKNRRGVNREVESQRQPTFFKYVY